MSTDALLFEDPEFERYSPQSVCLKGNREYEIGTELQLRTNDEVLGGGEVVGVATAPLDQLPDNWISRYHHPTVFTRYDLADILEERWGEVTTKELCTMLLLEMDLSLEA